MIKLSNFRDFDESIDEGKLLLAAMSVLTSIECGQIEKGEFGGSTSVEEIFDKIIEIANVVYYEDEYKAYLEALKRDKKIQDIIN